MLHVIKKLTCTIKISVYPTKVFVFVFKLIIITLNFNIPLPVYKTSFQRAARDTEHSTQRDYRRCEIKKELDGVPCTKRQEVRFSFF